MYSMLFIYGVFSSDVYAQGYEPLFSDNKKPSPSLTEKKSIYKYQNTPNPEHKFEPDLSKISRFNVISNSNPFFGCAPADDAFIKLALDTDTQECYDMKVSFDRLQPGESVSDKELIESDKSLCECLRDKARKMPALASVLNSDSVRLPNISENNPMLENFELNVKAEKKRMLQETHMLGLHASILSDGNAEFTAAYACHSSDAKSSSKRSISRNDLKNLRSDSPLIQYGADKRKEKARIDETVAKIIKDFDSPNEINLGYYKEKPFKSDQCIGSREFLSFKSLPQDDIIFQELSKDFKPDDWDHTLLRSQYDSLVGLPASSKASKKEEILKIKSKLIFLNSNPMFKYILGAHSDMDEYFSSAKIDKKEKKEILEAVNNDTLSRAKSELFNSLKRFGNVGNKCQGKPGACLQEATNNGGTKKLKEDLKKFYARDDILAIIKIQKEKEDHERSMGIQDNKYFFPPKKTLADNLSQEIIVKEFIDTTGLGNPANCTAGGADVVECAEIFSAYCKTIDTAIVKIRGQDGDDELKDNLDFKVASLLDTDIESNLEFSNFNNEICNTPRKKNPKDQNEKPLTFFQYKEVYCKSKGNPKECRLSSPADYEKIRTQFLTEYSSPADPSKQTIAQGFIDAFIKKTQDNPIKDMNSSEVQLALSRPSIKSLSNYRKSAGIEDRSVILKPVASNEGNQNSENLSQNRAVHKEPVKNDDSYVNYSNLSGPINTSTNGDKKIQDMSDAQRRELLDDWKKEYQASREDKSNKTGAENTNEAVMKSRIEALEALLSHQKKISEDQYKLLNEALAAKNNTASPNSAQDQRDVADSSPKKNISNAPGPQTYGREDYVRAPAGVRDSIFDSPQGHTSGSSLGNKSSSVSSNSTIDSSSKSSVEREEAKLVKRSENLNGSITIESVKGTSSANAITIPVSDDLYKMAQANPTGLDLSQIEKNIPKDQIAQLEKNGVIILLLKNGSNHPLEVKVRKENNVLVQVKNTQITPRKVSLEGLQNTLKSKNF
jgi:hypothetical protein